jgi:hypothetical protein
MEKRHVPVLFECGTCGAFYYEGTAKRCRYVCEECGDYLETAHHLPDQDDPYESPR